MIELMIISSLIIIMCITSSKIFYKFGMPILLIFVLMGMLSGSDGIIGIQFNDYDFTAKLCSLGLVFIMFYGGFGTNWKMAKSVAIPSALMSSAGVLLTAFLTGLFCYFVLELSLLEGLLVGSILASTDSASVFAMLRTQKLDLKGSLASTLELESGSNDPMAYMLTITILSMMKDIGSISLISTMLSIIYQIILAFGIGYLLAKATVKILKISDFEIEGFYTIFVVAIALLSYALAEFIGANGYLSVYISGIVLGNSKIHDKSNMFHFLDALSWVMQIALFFLIGLLSFPSRLQYVSSSAISIALFMLVFARPIVVYLLLSPFGYSKRERFFISWVGLRGAGSVVFAIFATTYGVNLSIDIFHTVFCVALISVGIQGALIPKLANKLNLIDENEKGSVLKTFTDYAGEVNADLLEVIISEDSVWKDRIIMELDIPEDTLIIMIKRNGKIIVPRGNTKILGGDVLVFTGDNIDKLLDKMETLLA